MALLPPSAARTPHRREHHGDVIIDNYEWLRQKDDPAVVAHLEAENAYTDEQLADLEPLREQLFSEIKGHTQETDLSVPLRKGDWWYYGRTVEGKQYGIQCRAPIGGPDDWTPPRLSSDEDIPGEQILLDNNVEAEGHEFYSLGSFDTTPDGTALLVGVDLLGDERYTVRLRDIATGRDLGDVLPNTSAGALFDPTGAFVYYTTVDDSWRPDTVWRHRVGTPASEDESIFHEPDESYWVGVGLTRSRRFLVIEASSSVTSECRILDTDDPTGDFRIVWPREQGVEYSVDHAVLGGVDRLVIVHNKGAADFMAVDVAIDSPLESPHILVPHTPGTRVESVDAFANHLVLEFRQDGLPRVAIATLDTDPSSTSPVGEWSTLQFDEVLFSAGTAGNPEWTQPVVRLHYSSYVTPSTVINYTVATGEREVLKQHPVPGYDSSLYEMSREWATATDGTRVPISLVYRSDLRRPGAPAPTLLYGYGSYEASIDPGFSVARISLLDRGVVFAIAHVRGGGELGRNWYEDGKKLQKVNTFTDFVACAQHLVDTGWSSPDRLVAEGGSAGGLLMGAVANIAPDLFSGILAVVPFVDPLTSILDPSLPLTVIEWDEWGDPLHNADVYALMRSYSPYENVEAKPYPPILAITSINDTRVLYVEPAKWVARLREVDAPVLLRTEMSAGHGGVSGRYESWRKKAFEYAWVLRRLGLATSV
jgi:oligopeptidase B